MNDRSLRLPRNRLKISEMKKTFDNKMACINHRLKKWSNKFKKQVFTFKTKDKYDESLEVMPAEKYFDYLQDIHVTHTDHGDVEKMMEVIKEEGVWMPYEAVFVFNKVCSKCTVMRKMSYRLFNARRTPNQSSSTELPKSLMRGFVEIIDMHSKPDGDYKYILHYRDMSTQFSRLRPLKNPIASEVAEELFPMFMTTGAPAVLHAPVKRAFTAAIIKHLEPFMPDTKILVGNRKKSRKKEDKIPVLVNKWMENSKKKNWSYGIYYVECKMNNKKTKSNKLSAYETMFQRTHGIGLYRRFSNTAARSLFKKLQYEKDLLLPSVEKYVLGAGEDITKTVKVSSENTQMESAWCAVCGFDLADSMCQVCGVAMHRRCNADGAQMCDCCKTFSDNHDHLKQDYVKANSFIVLQSDNATGSNAPKSSKVVKTIKRLVKVTNPQLSKTKVVKLPASLVEVPKTDERIENVASTSAESSNTVALTDETTAFKVGRVIRQYGKPMQPRTYAKRSGAVVGSVGDFKKQKTNDSKDDNTIDVKNDTNIVADAVKIKVETVNEKDDANVKVDAVNVKEEAVDVQNDIKEVKQEADMEVAEGINLFDEILEIEKNDPF